jgi:hypothetical protein
MRPCTQSAFGKILSIAIAASYCPLLSVTTTVAQVETTTAIRGLVSDSSGAFVPGAQVEVRNVNTGEKRTALTNGQGSYSFLSLLPGTYNLTVTRDGFKTGIVENRVIQVGVPAEVDVNLQTGAAAETVTVSAAGSELINTTTAEVSSVVPSTLVANVPLNGRNLFDLAALAPGAVPQSLTTTQISFAQKSLNFVQAAGMTTTSGIILSGMRDSSVNVSVDGSNVQSPVYQMSTSLQSPDDIQEMKIESGNMNAEFGNGVSAVNVITKSGTNQYHGDFYDYFRNAVLDANTYFANLANSARPDYQWNQFGAAGGGPIKRNKLLFFSNYEGLRLKESSFATELVPDASLRSGDFSGTGTTIYNPYSYNPATGLRNPFPGNKIPEGPTNLCAPRPTCVDPAVLAFIQSWVLPPNGVNSTGQPAVLGDEPTTMNRDQATLRMDWLQSANSLIYGRFTYFNATALSKALQPLEGVNNPYGSKTAVLHWTQNISATILNDAMIGYSRPIWVYSANPNAPDVSSQIGIANTVPLPGGPGFSGTPYNLDATSTFNLTGTDNKIQGKDDLSLARGRHNFKVGGEVIDNRFTYPSQSNFKGSFAVTDTWSAACPGGNLTCSGAFGSGSQGGLAYADLLLGALNNSLFQSVSDPYNGRQVYYGVYGQDSWRITRNLTINYGLRYEHWTPWTVPNNTTVGFDFNTQQIRYALLNPLDYLDPAKCYGKCAPLNPGVPRQNYTVSNLDFAPRVGLAYNLHAQTVIHAAFGIFHNGNWNNNQFSNIQTGAAPFFLRDQLQSDVSAQLPPNLISAQFPPPGPTGLPLPNSNPPATFRFVWPRYPMPAIDEWSLSLQQGLGTYWSFEVSYVGSHDIHEFQYINPNAAALPQGSVADVPLQQRRPYTQWGVLGTWAPIGWNRYNGLMVSLKNRSWHNLTVIANYTWQKSIVSDDIGSSDEGQSNFRSPYIFSGTSGITPLNSFVVGYSYQLPFGRGKRFGNSPNPVIDGIAGGWLVSGITTMSDGSPQAIETQDESNTGEGLPLASLAPNCDPRNVPGGRGRLEWFNTACFVNPAYGTYGNSRLGAITEPGINDWDISVGKTFSIPFPGEAARAQIRGDFFNAFNHTQWGPPDEYLPDTTYGQINTTRDPRIVQVSLRVSF